MGMFDGLKGKKNKKKEARKDGAQLLLKGDGALSKAMKAQKKREQMLKDI